MLLNSFAKAKSAKRVNLKALNIKRISVQGQAIKLLCGSTLKE